MKINGSSLKVGGKRGSAPESGTVKVMEDYLEENLEHLNNAEPIDHLATINDS